MIVGKRVFSWSIRSQLMTLVLVAIVPALVIILINGFELKDSRIREAHERSLSAVKNLATQQITDHKQHAADPQHPCPDSPGSKRRRTVMRRHLPRSGRSESHISSFQHRHPQWDCVRLIAPAQALFRCRQEILQGHNQKRGVFRRGIRGQPGGESSHPSLRLPDQDKGRSHPAPF